MRRVVAYALVMIMSGCGSADLTVSVVTETPAPIMVVTPVPTPFPTPTPTVTPVYEPISVADDEQALDYLEALSIDMETLGKLFGELYVLYENRENTVVKLTEIKAVSIELMSLETPEQAAMLGGKVEALNTAIITFCDEGISAAQNSKAFDAAEKIQPVVVAMDDLMALTEVIEW